MRYLASDTKTKESTIRPATPGLWSQPGTSKQQEVDITPQHPLNPQTSFQSRGISSKLEEMLRKQRSNFKALQRAIHNINLDAMSQKWEFEDALRSVQARWSVIDVLHWEIDSELYDVDEEYEQAFTKFECMYIDIKRNINSKMWSESHRAQSTPQIDIPYFSGSFQTWLSFKDLFVETIHRNRCLSNAQKMQYLKGKLKGEAEKLVQHLNISSDNYAVCWDILDHRFSNSKLIFNSHMNTITNLPIMQHQSAPSIKEIHDTTNECLNAIKNIGVNIDTWDPLIVYLVSQKLDTETHSDYIESLKNPRDLPSLKEFLSFLEGKFTALESSKRRQEQPKTYQQPQKSAPAAYPKAFQKSHIFKSFVSNKQSPSQNLCPICNKNHTVSYCNKFAELQPNLQLQTISKLQLCQNCLFNHRGNKCFSVKRCHICNDNHHTLVHEAFKQQNHTQDIISTNNPENQPINSSHVSLDDTQDILLATALVAVQAADGTSIIMRALIDQGSQTSLITENAAQRLGLQRQNCKGIILGLGAKENACKGFMNLKIASIYSDYSLNTGLFIMNHAVNNLPNKSFNKPAWSFIEDIQLADPEFYRRRSVDLLLGADVYASIIMEGIIKQSESFPVAQQTRLGWILCGNVKSYQCNVVLVDVDSLQKFWSIEDINENIDMSEEDHQCIQLYKSTTTHQTDGKEVLRLPLYPDADEKLGVSKTKACTQFYQVERKLQKDNNLFNKYKSFIEKYIELGHMHLTIARNMKPSYYMPHHGVHRPDSSTTSLQVVFNASEKLLSDRKKQQFHVYDHLEAKKIRLSNVVTKCNHIPANFIFDFISKDSSLTHAPQILAWILRAFSLVTKRYIIIPHNSRLTNLLIDLAHKATFHLGARLTHSWLRQRYWTLVGNRAIKKRLFNCIICKRHNAVKQTQLLENLPGFWTNPSRPFFHTGVDFTGYVDVKSSKGRGIKTTKGYAAVFICMVTKAVHLELVSDLSSSTFLAALRRLSARRGTPRHLYSDNGTNFIGANKRLANEFIYLQSNLSKDFFTEISEMKIEWHFNAPSWPSAGGLWEAAVKSLKYHLRRVLGDQKLTYEEFATVLHQLEACLNSRPLSPLSEDPDDLAYLTPAHFLASGPILTIVETERDERTRWQLTQKIFNDIWKRWRAEYLMQLSARSKWKTSKPNINLNDIVIIHDALLPPGKWALGRVVDLHPGSDGHVRVVSVKTKSGVIKRPVIKLSNLPVNTE